MPISMRSSGLRNATSFVSAGNMLQVAALRFNLDEEDPDIHHAVRVAEFWVSSNLLLSFPSLLRLSLSGLGAEVVGVAVFALRWVAGRKSHHC